MNHVKSLNLFGVEAKEIPCITGSGAPTTATESAVGCLYMDTATGDVYKCTAAEDGVYTWEEFGSEKVVQTTGNDDLSVMSQKASSKCFANAPKATAKGNAINITDVSPNTHPISVKVGGVENLSSVRVITLGKNLFMDVDFGKKSNVTLTKENGYYVLNGKPASRSTFSSGIVYLPAGTYTLGAKNPANTGSNEQLVSLYSVNADGTAKAGSVAYIYNKTNYGKTTVTISAGYYKVRVQVGSADGTFNNFKFQPQLEFGGEETEYEECTAATYTPNTDGTVNDAVSKYPAMTILTNNESAVVEIEYNKDINKVMSSGSAASSFPYNNYAIPTIYLDGDIVGMSKDNAVTLGYKYGDRTGTCTLKWQGSSSIAYPKKNYTIVFDNEFEAVEGWGAEKKYCLKADWIDASHSRNVVSAKLWGEAVRTRANVDSRLNALPNCGAIDGFPCFVVINGEWMGVYNFNIPKDGWMFGMKDDTAKHAILCAGNHTSACKFKAEAVINTDFDLEYNSEAFTESEVQASLNRLINACRNSDGSDIDTTIAQYLDINSAIDYYIFFMMLNGIDIVTKNYILATYDGTKWFFSAYDLDCVFGLDWDGSKFLAPTKDWLRSGRDLHAVFNLLFYYKRAELVARYRELRAGAFSVSEIMNKFYNYGANIPRTAFDAEVSLWKTIPCNNGNDVGQIVNWYQERVKIVDAQIEELAATI